MKAIFLFEKGKVFFIAQLAEMKMIQSGTESHQMSVT
jgi:hypothetical protein